MKKGVIIVIIFLVIILGVAFFLKSRPQGPGKLDSFAKCIADSGAKFYGAFWCPHCREQKQMFGSSVKYLPYVECSTPDGQGQLQVCKDLGITGYPTWDFKTATGTERVVGTQDFSYLASKTSCQLPQ